MNEEKIVRFLKECRDVLFLNEYVVLLFFFFNGKLMCYSFFFQWEVILNCKLSLDLQNVRPSVRTTISPAVFIGFFQYRTQGIITMSRASWEKLFFFGSFSGRFLPFLGLSVRPYVPLYLLQFLSDSFNIAHRASLQCRGRHGRNFFFFFFRSFSGRFLPFLGLSVRPYHYISCSFYRILSISHTGHHYNVAGVMGETFFFRVIFGPFSAIFRLKIKIL